MQGNADEFSYNDLCMPCVRSCSTLQLGCQQLAGQKSTYLRKGTLTEDQKDQDSGPRYEDAGSDLDPGYLGRSSSVYRFCYMYSIHIYVYILYTLMCLCISLYM